MDLKNFCRIMGFGPEAERILEDDWKTDVATFPGRVEFMEMDFARRYFPLTGGDPALFAEMTEVARITAGCPAARLYAWALYRRHFLGTVGRTGSMPLPEHVFGKLAGMFQLMVAVGALPLIEKKFTELGLPHEYVEGVARWINGTIQIYRSGHGGLPGHNLSQTFWIRYYVDGRLFRIGRFEYLIGLAPDCLPAVFRRKGTRETVALCRDGWEINAEGHRRAPAEPDGRTVLTTKFEIRDGRACGTPIAPDGRALVDQFVALDLKEWEAPVTPYEWVPGIHIPGGGGMTPETVRESLLAAKGFFRRYFQRDIRLFWCVSWALNPDWETELPDSNLAKWQKLFYLTPSPSYGHDGLFFIFGRSADDWSGYPADNSVRRAFHRLREKGRCLRTGGMFVLTEDLDDLRDGFYRDGWTLPQ